MNETTLIAIFEALLLDDRFVRKLADAIFNTPIASTKASWGVTLDKDGKP